MRESPVRAPSPAPQAPPATAWLLAAALQGCLAPELLVGREPPPGDARETTAAKSTGPRPGDARGASADSAAAAGSKAGTYPEVLPPLPAGSAAGP